MLATIDLLKTFGLFKALSDSDLEFLCSHSNVKRYDRRAVILQAGLSENKVCMLFEGRLQGIDFTIDGKEVGLYFVEPGDYCGELCVFDSGTQPEYVISLNSSVVVIFPAETIREVAQRNPSIMLQLGKKTHDTDQTNEHPTVFIKPPESVPTGLSSALAFGRYGEKQRNAKNR
jgi:CRP-like cAMP-binding protein